MTRFARSAPVKPGVPAASVSSSISAGQGLPLRVHLEDLLAAVPVGTVDDDLPVEASGAKQRRIEDVGPVRGRDQNDVVLQLEPVHLDEELVQGLLALVVAAAQPGAAMAADRVDLVHEDDARRGLLGLLEKVADAAGAHADEHLDEVRARDREERHTGLAGDRAGQQRLTGARRPVEQHALGNARAEGLELLGVLEELLDLVQLLHGLFDAGHVLEADLRGVGRHPLGAALAEAHHLRAAALHLVHQEDPEADQQQERQERDQQRRQREAPLALRVVVDALLLQEALEGQLRLVARVVRLRGRRVALQVRRDLALVRVEGDLLDVLGVVPHQPLDLGVRVLLLVLVSAHERLARQVDE